MQTKFKGGGGNSVQRAPMAKNSYLVIFLFLPYKYKTTIVIINVLGCIL